ncbi:MAG: peptidoglycan editing factor PgeF [Proteobacteria bacterium]|nr:peptidoglycan editing factor PgeF [Pseudomonadota bacterium]
MLQQMINPIINDSLNCSHGFFTRQGGVGGGYFHSLNCGNNKGDDTQIVEENRQLILNYFKNKYSHYNKNDLKLILGVQEHSNKAIWVDDVFTPPLPSCDALVTNKKGFILGVLTADCCPILMFDPKSNMIAAIHAGWKGAISGIIESTVDLMVQKGASLHDIRSAIGPCLAVDHFEVREDFIQFLNENTPFLVDDYLIQSNNRNFFDLVSYVRKRLEQKGIGHIASSFKDTYSNEDLFFSYRRKTHKNEPYFGVQLSAIGL